jgi:hypothetical protein
LLFSKFKRDPNIQSTESIVNILAGKRLQRVSRSCRISPKNVDKLFVGRLRAGPDCAIIVQLGQKYNKAISIQMLMKVSDEILNSIKICHKAKNKKQ